MVAFSMPGMLVRGTREERTKIIVRRFHSRRLTRTEEHRVKPVAESAATEAQEALETADEDEEDISKHRSKRTNKPSGSEREQSNGNKRCVKHVVSRTLKART